MFQNLIRKYIDFSINRRTKNISRKKHFANFQDVSSILLLFSTDTISEKEVEYIQKILGDKKKISAWVFNPKESYLRNTINQNLLGKKDISILQKPSGRIEKIFLNNEYDLLIDLTTKEILPLKYLLGISRASCRCGMKKEGYTFYDLEIDMPSGTKETELLKQILHYLNAIKTKS